MNVLLTSQQIKTYYERHKATELTFTKEIAEVTGLISKQTALKCMGEFWPCLIYATSFESAKIVANTKSGLIQKLQEANNAGSLKFSFANPETGNPIVIFVGCRSVGYTPYGASRDMGIISLQFTQRPPDDLIVILGQILDAHVNSVLRRGERIIITNDTQRRLSIRSRDIAITIQGVPRQCILRDISFYGVKVIIMGIAKFLENKDVELIIEFDEPSQSFSLKGKFVRSEQVEGRKELVAMAIALDEAAVPMGYKTRINNYISMVRADNRWQEQSQDQSGAAADGAV
ncbi:MAG: PilZ domain-containing protein [Spirochaetaceae bacterium]|jgi:hypothetical protein|nr:PilZ domain-containing protein [Spirochaetaceae bacterium]